MDPYTLLIELGRSYMNIKQPQKYSPSLYYMLLTWYASPIIAFSSQNKQENQSIHNHAQIKHLIYVNGITIAITKNMKLTPFGWREKEGKWKE